MNFFCPSRLGQKFEFLSSFFGRIKDTKKTFRKQLTFSAKLTKNLYFKSSLDNIKVVELTSHMQGRYPLGISNTWRCTFVQQNMGSFFVTISTGPVASGKT